MGHMSQRTKRSANQKCHAAVLRLLHEKDIPRKDFIADRGLLRIRCRTFEQMDTFPQVLKASIENQEIEMLAFPGTLKGIKTYVYFICPTQGNKDNVYIRFNNGFDCKIIAAKSERAVNLETEVKKKGWKCDSCGFSNLQWKSKCFRCRADKPSQDVIATANGPVRPNVILASMKELLDICHSKNVEA